MFINKKQRVKIYLEGMPAFYKRLREAREDCYTILVSLFIS